MTAKMRLAMYDEARLFFQEVLRDNLKLTTLIDSNSTYLNENLATIYGMERTVRGEEIAARGAVHEADARIPRPPRRYFEAQPALVQVDLHSGGCSGGAGLLARRRHRQSRRRREHLRRRARGQDEQHHHGEPEHVFLNAQPARWFLQIYRAAAGSSACSSCAAITFCAMCDGHSS